MPARSPSLTRAVIAEVLQEHRLVLAIAIPYIVIAGAVLYFLGQPWHVRFTTLPFIAVWLAGTGCWFLAAYLGSPKRLRACLRAHRVLGAVLVALLAVPVQTSFQSLKQAIGVVIGFPWDRRLDRWDRLIHGGPAWHWFSVVIAHRTALRTIDALYLLWFLQVLALFIWASWTPNRLLRERTLIAMLLLWIGAGTIGAAVTASAGPCYVPVAEYQELVRRLDAYSPELFARFNQQGIWKLHEERIWGPLAGVSAMPSMHVAFATLAAFVAWTRARWLGVVAALYAIAIQVGAVVLAWHYAIDGYAGAISASCCWVAAGYIGEKREATLNVFHHIDERRLARTASSTAHKHSTDEIADVRLRRPAT